MHAYNFEYFRLEHDFALLLVCHLHELRACFLTEVELKIWPDHHLTWSSLCIFWDYVSFRSPSLFYLLTAGVDVVYLHLITLRHTPQSVGLLWTRDRPVAETSTWQYRHSQETNIHAPGGIRTYDPSKRSVADLRLRPRGHWDRPTIYIYSA
jgi:hypothetical protein